MKFASSGEINFCFSQAFRMTGLRDAREQYIFQSAKEHLRKLNI